MKGDEFPDKMRIPVGTYSFEDKKKAKGSQIQVGGKMMRGARPDEIEAAHELQTSGEEDEDNDSMSDVESSGAEAAAAAATSSGAHCHKKWPGRWSKRGQREEDEGEGKGEGRRHNCQEGQGCDIMYKSIVWIARQLPEGGHRAHQCCGER